MHKFKLHVKTDNMYFDDKVFVNIQLPHTPRKGEVIYLKPEHYDELEKLAKCDLDIANEYAPKWFYGSSNNIIDLTEKDLENLQFGDANTVSNIIYEADKDVTHIILE